MKLKHKIGTIVGLCSMTFSCFAQQYVWTATVDSVNEDGFYKIVWNPELSGKSLQADHSDLRVIDSKQAEVPYFFKAEPGSTDKRWFKEYQILSKEILPKRLSSLIVHNPDKNKISNFSLVVKNNDAYKFASLSGSDDNQTWYFITADYPLSQMYDEANVASEKSIYFPLSNYEYYKLEINDSASAPLNILRIGNYSTATEWGKPMQVPVKSLQQQDSMQKKSYAIITFDAAYQINQLKFTIKGPKFYKREAVLYSFDTTAKGEEYTREWSRFYLSSATVNSFAIPEWYGKKMLLEINNEDNPPLQLAAIDAFQTSRYIVAHLNKDEHYTLLVGNSKAPRPEYDLSYFADSIPAVLPELRVLSFNQSNTSLPVSSKPNVAWFKNKAWIWVTLMAVIGLLVFVSYRMVKEMKEKVSGE